MIPTLRSYVQAHQIHTDLFGSDQAQFEGIAESTFDTVKDAGLHTDVKKKRKRQKKEAHR
jgi:hypothetical protein